MGKKVDQTPYISEFGRIFIEFVNMTSGSLFLLTGAGVLFSGGVILGMFTAWSMVRMSYYFWTTDFGVELGSTMIMVVGSMLCMPVCGVASLIPSYPKSQPLIGTMIMLSSATLVMLSLGLSSMSHFFNLLRDQTALNASMFKAMSKESFHLPTRNSFASMQLEMHCCGVQHSSDWLQYRYDFPPSCCNRIINTKSEEGETCDTPLFVSGCIGPALAELRYYVNSSCILAGVLIVVLGIMLATSAYVVIQGAERAEERAYKLKAAALARELSTALPQTYLHAPPPLPTQLIHI